MGDSNVMCAHTDYSNIEITHKNLLIINFDIKLDMI